MNIYVSYTCQDEQVVLWRASATTNNEWVKAEIQIPTDLKKTKVREKHLSIPTLKVYPSELEELLNIWRIPCSRIFLLWTNACLQLEECISCKRTESTLQAMVFGLQLPFQASQAVVQLGLDLGIKVQSLPAQGSPKWVQRECPIVEETAKRPPHQHSGWHGHALVSLPSYLLLFRNKQTDSPVL